MSTRSHWQVKAASFFIAAFASWAQNVSDDLTSLSYISYLERYATIKPASQGETLDAVVNMPVLPGDRVETARGARMEIQLADGSTVWLDQFTTLDFDGIAQSRGSSAPRTALYLAAGGIAVEVAPQAASVLVNSPAGNVYLTRNGLYRVVLEGDQLKVGAHRGAAELPAGMGSVLLRAGFAAWVADNEELQRVEWSGDRDDFWRWVLERRTTPSQSPTAKYVQKASKAYVLDAYGEWVYVSDLRAWGWRPRVSITWVPYSYGRWYWTPAGWCWVSYEPWGWYPYHYGSWYFSVSFGWVWFYDPIWAPAWVHWIYTPGYVGWCPRGYYDWWWWQHGYRGHPWPHRWSEVSFDFSGRVRLGHIDHRPWTFVPEDRFTHSHIERVRLDSDRIIRSIGDREAIVRSGPLIGPAPRDLGRPAEFRELFREPATREVTSYLRREARGPMGEGSGPVVFRTSEAVRLAKPSPGRLPGEQDGTLPSPERSSSRRPQPTVESSRPSLQDPEVMRLPEGRRQPERLERPEGTPRAPSSWQPRTPRPDTPEPPRGPSRRENVVPRSAPDRREPSPRVQLPRSYPERSGPPSQPETQRALPKGENPRLRDIPTEATPRTPGKTIPLNPPPSSRPPQSVSPPRVTAPPPSSAGTSRNASEHHSSVHPPTDRPRD